MYTMDEFDIDTVARMLEFMYLGDYQGLDETNLNIAPTGAVTAPGSGATQDTAEGIGKGESLPGIADVLKAHLRVNSVGDYFCVKTLVAAANKKLKDAVRPCLQLKEDPVSVLSAEQARHLETMAACLPGAIEYATKHTGDKKVLNVLAAAAAAQINHLLPDLSFRQLDMGSDLTYKMFEHMSEELNMLREKVRATTSTVRGTQTSRYSRG